MKRHTLTLVSLGIMLVGVVWLFYLIQKVHSYYIQP